MKKVTFSNNIPMRWEFFMGYRCYSPCVMWTYPKSALTPISCVQTVAYSIKNHKPWECKNLMQVSFKWLIEPHEIGVWHLQRAKTILYSWDPPTTPISPVLSIDKIRKLYPPLQANIDVENSPFVDHFPGDSLVFMVLHICFYPRNFGFILSGRENVSRSSNGWRQYLEDHNTL